MNINLGNEHLKLTFDKKGAELKSITGSDSGTEYLWSGDERFWGKVSPLLFPIVGALKDNSYSYNGNVYTLPRHGFARDMAFDVEQIDEHEVVFHLQSNADTLKVYPFNFKLSVRYKLDAASLTCTYQVENEGQDALFFSLGAHPAFAVPLNNEGTYTDYYLEFNQDDQINYHHIENNLIADRVSTIALTERKLMLRHDLFYDDALVIKDLKSNSVSIMNTKNYNGVNLKFHNFPYFGIWAAKDADFVCLEPWQGIADSVNAQGNIEEKEGIINLVPQELWTASWTVTFF